MLQVKRELNHFHWSKSAGSCYVKARLISKLWMGVKKVFHAQYFAVSANLTFIRG